MRQHQALLGAGRWQEVEEEGGAEEAEETPSSDSSQTVGPWTETIVYNVIH